MVFMVSGMMPVWLFSQENHQHKSHSGYPQLAGEIISATMQYSGSPNLFDRFTEGNVIMLSGAEVPVNFLRYDALNDELFWMQPDEKGLVKVDKNLIAGFHMEHPSQDSLLRFYRNAILEIDGLRCRDCFIQVLYEGEFSLYARRSKRITSRSETVTRGSRSQRVRILDDDFSYLLIFPDGTMQTVRPSIRSFINAVPVDKRELRRAIRRKNIQINDDKELVQAVKWFNSYIEQPKEISE